MLITNLRRYPSAGTILAGTIRISVDHSANLDIHRHNRPDNYFRRFSDDLAVQSITRTRTIPPFDAGPSMVCCLVKASANHEGVHPWDERSLRPRVGLFAPLRDKVTSSAQSLVPSAQPRVRSASFDHLVGRHLHDQRHGKTERLRGLEVDHEFELGRLFHRQVGAPYDKRPPASTFSRR